MQWFLIVFQSYNSDQTTCLFVFCRIFWIFCSRLHTASWRQHQDRKPELQTGLTTECPLIYQRGKKCSVVLMAVVSRLCICSTWSRSVRQFLRIWRCSTTPLASRSMMFPQICLTMNATMSLTQTRGAQKRTTPGQECWCQTVDTLVTLALALAQSAAAHKCSHKSDRFRQLIGRQRQIHIFRLRIIKYLSK